MKYRLMTAVSGAALSLGLLAGAGFAQELGLKQLQDTATQTMAKLNMDTSMVEMLTLDELAQIQGVGSAAGSQDQQKMRIETILRDAEARIAAGGAVAPTAAVGDVAADDLDGDMVVKANVGAFVGKLGLSDEIDVDMLTTDQLLQVQLVEGMNLNVDEQRIKVRELVGG